MTLAAFKIATRAVSFTGGPLELRGLSLDDFSALMRDYLEDLDSLFKLYDDAEKRNEVVGESAKFAIGVVRDAPQLVGLLIANCANEPDSVAVARQLPLAVQVECVKVIIEMTFEEAGGAKKFVDMIMTMVGNLRPKAATEA